MSLEEQSCLSSCDGSDNEKDSERLGLRMLCPPPATKKMSQQHIYLASVARCCCLKVVFSGIKNLSV